MDISGIIAWFTGNWEQLANIAAWLISGSSILVFFLPWLPDNHIFKGAMRILGKIALNRTRPKP